jgi:hypothetical protein
MRLLIFYLYGLIGLNQLFCDPIEIKNQFSRISLSNDNQKQQLKNGNMFVPKTPESEIKATIKTHKKSEEITKKVQLKKREREAKKEQEEQKFKNKAKRLIKEYWGFVERFLNTVNGKVTVKIVKIAGLVMLVIGTTWFILSRKTNPLENFFKINKKLIKNKKQSPLLNELNAIPEVKLNSNLKMMMDLKMLSHGSETVAQTIEKLKNDTQKEITENKLINLWKILTDIFDPKEEDAKDYKEKPSILSFKKLSKDYGLLVSNFTTNDDEISVFNKLIKALSIYHVLIGLVNINDGAMMTTYLNDMAISHKCKYSKIVDAIKESKIFGNAHTYSPLITFKGVQEINSMETQDDWKNLLKNLIYQLQQYMDSFLQTYIDFIKKDDDNKKPLEDLMAKIKKSNGNNQLSDDKMLAAFLKSKINIIAKHLLVHSFNSEE